MTFQIAIDCADPARLVAFWGPALRYVPRPAPDGFATWVEFYRSVGVPDEELPAEGDALDRLMDPEGKGPNIWFQPVPEPKTVKNRIHLDLYPGGGRSVPLEQRIARAQVKVEELLALGATIVRRFPEDFPGAPPEADHWFRVMADPEGNEFCVS